MEGLHRGCPKALSDAVDADRFVAPVQAASGIRPVDLPDAYGTETLVLLVRDPHWIFAFWELARPAAAPLRLNVHRLDRRGEASDLVASYGVGPIGRFHIPVPFRGARYAAALHAEGEASPRLSSNVVSTPPGEPSDLEDEAWLTVRELFTRAYAVPGSGFSPGLAMARSGFWLAEGWGGSPLSSAPSGLGRRWRHEPGVTGGGDDAR